MSKASNTNIQELTPLIPPQLLIHNFPSNDTIAQHVLNGREEIQNILDGKDKRLLAIVGPCSVHDLGAALAYAKKLKILAAELKNKLCIVMRVYFEKPRTTVGWKGLIYDPHLDGSADINEGLSTARKLLLQINELGVHTATEFVDTITPQFIADLVGWAAIGARTTESQIHRTLASGLSMPVGFKNNTAGDVSVAVNAVVAASHPHRFLGITPQGLSAIVDTKGHQHCHVILRGGAKGTNFDANTVQQTAALLAKQKRPTKVMIDCSHGNSDKDYKKQADVIKSICEQVQQPNHNIMGFMLESNLVEGNQPLSDNLTYGQSITDACVNWEETETLLRTVADQL